MPNSADRPPSGPNHDLNNALSSASSGPTGKRYMAKSHKAMIEACPVRGEGKMANTVVMVEVAPVSHMRDLSSGAGWGFNLTGPYGAPLATLIYETEAHAAAARENMKKALLNLLSFTSQG